MSDKLYYVKCTVDHIGRLFAGQLQSKHKTLSQCFLDIGPPSAILAQHLGNIG